MWNAKIKNIKGSDIFLKSKFIAAMYLKMLSSFNTKCFLKFFIYKKKQHFFYKSIKSGIMWCQN